MALCINRHFYLHLINNTLSPKCIWNAGPVAGANSVFSPIHFPRWGKKKKKKNRSHSLSPPPSWKHLCQSLPKRGNSLSSFIIDSAIEWDAYSVLAWLRSRRLRVMHGRMHSKRPVLDFFFYVCGGTTLDPANVWAWIMVLVWGMSFILLQRFQKR